MLSTFCRLCPTRLSPTLPHSVLTAILGGRKQSGLPRLTQWAVNGEWGPGVGGRLGRN